MDTTPRMAALRTAKAIIASHGITAHMNKYNRDVLARDVQDTTIGLRYDFHLDPSRTNWSEMNPSCTLNVTYSSDPKGSRIDESGAMVIDNILRITVSASADNMDMPTMKRREDMVSMLFMLCAMLQEVLAPQLTLTMETPETVADNARRAHEQQVGQHIFNNIGADVFKGLRSDGSGRPARLTSAYSSPDGKYPQTGTYRFRHVRLTDRQGRPKDIAYYSIRVFGSDGTVPPTVFIHRVSSHV